MALAFLSVDAVNSLTDINLDYSVQKENFYSAAKKKFTELVDFCDGDIKGIEDDFDKVAINELNKCSNEEYRRMLIKTLSTVADGRIKIECAETVESFRR